MFVKDALVNKLNKNIIFYYLDAKPNCLSPCYCLFCAKCANKIIEHQMMTCPICKHQINFQKITGLNNELLSIFENQDSNIKRMQQIIKIQKKNKAQFINYLEHKIKSLAEENKNLKKYIISAERSVNNNINNERDLMSKSYYSTYTTTNNHMNRNLNNSIYNCSTSSTYNMNNNNSIFKTPNVADRNSNLKRIEVKKSSERQSSIKYSPYINKYNDNLKNNKNLNAQTAFEQQFSSKQGNNINVNINNNNSNTRTLNLSRSRNNSIEKLDINQKNFGRYNGRTNS